VKAIYSFTLIQRTCLAFQSRSDPPLLESLKIFGYLH